MGSAHRAISTLISTTIFLATTTHVVLVQAANVTVTVKKCCPSGSVLVPSSPSSSSSSGLRCAEAGLVESPISFLPEEALDVGGRRLVPSPWLSSSHHYYPVGRPDCDRVRALEMSSDPYAYLVTTEGSLVSLEGVFETELRLGEFCLDLALAQAHGRERGNGGGYYRRVALVCDPCGRGGVTCIHTCCNHQQVAEYRDDGDDGGDGDGFTCSKRMPVAFSPAATKRRWHPGFEDDVGGVQKHALLHRSLSRCDANSVNRAGVVLDLRRHEGGFIIFRNGSVVLRNDPSGHLYRPDRYCLAFPSSESDLDPDQDPYLRLCPEEDQEGKTFLQTKAYPICCLVSNVFLLLTFLVYMILPELRRPLFGRLIVAFVVSLFVAYLFISMIALGHQELMMAKGAGDEYSAACRALSFLVLFWFLHTFAWMNILSYDIFCKFTRFRSSASASTSAKDRDDGDVARLTKYTAYAISVPLAVTLVTLTVEFLPDSYGGLRPDFGVDRCFFGSYLANFLFLHLHLLAMQVANVVFFALTTASIYRTWRATRKMSRHQGRKSKGSRSINGQIKIIAKLFVVMGITWMSEFVAFLLEWILGPDAVWKYTIFNDVVNLSQGILIFAVLVCKKTTLLRLRDRLCNLVCKRDSPVAAGNGGSLQRPPHPRRQSTPVQLTATSSSRCQTCHHHLSTEQTRFDGPTVESGYSNRAMAVAEEDEEEDWMPEAEGRDKVATVIDAVDTFKKQKSFGRDSGYEIGVGVGGSQEEAGPSGGGGGEGKGGGEEGFKPASLYNCVSKER